MTKSQLETYRKQLLELAGDVQENVADVTELARQANGGEASGGISNAPMHLGDLGSEAYTQELNSTLLETEQGMARDISEALGRIEIGTFGVCEECGKEIPSARLDAIPYAQYCVHCADSVPTDPPANLNKGRPLVARDTLSDTDTQGTSISQKKRHQSTTAHGGRPTPDSAAGTAGGGTASGGLAGTNEGHGDPEDVDLERATASGEYAPESEDPDSGYSGAEGGAVGGTPAGKRASGGRTRESK
jgi:RNA polymerase-binding transcription factor DksA